MLRGRLPTIRFISLELTWFIIFVISLLLIILELVVFIYIYRYDKLRNGFKWSN